MSKSGGGGGLKSHDKGSAGSVKVVKKNASLEAALEQVPDAILCPEGHRMKLHGGSKREGNLTCDGPDDYCCGRDGDGILYVGEPRYSCVECDFDICETCVDLETKEPLTPEQEKEAARQRLREKLGRGGGGGAAKAAAAKAEEERALAAKRAEVQATVAAKRAEIAKAVEEAKAAAAAKAAAEAAPAAAAETGASKGAKKKKKKAKKAKGSPANAAIATAEAEDDEEDEDEEAPESPTTAAAEPQAANVGPTFAFSFAPAPAAPVVASAVASTPPPKAAPATAAAPAKPFAFDFSLSTPPPKVKGANLDSSDDESDDSEDEGAADVPPASPVAVDSSDENDDGAVDVADAASMRADAALSKEGLLKAPESPLCCPFTNEIMDDPVVLADGYTYERKPALAYLAKFDRSPRTGEKLASKAVIANHMAKELCSCAKTLEM